MVGKLIASVLLAVTAAQAEPGALLERWTGLEGDTVAELTAAPAYAAAAPELRVLDHMAYENLGPAYGARLSALLTPRQSGSYRFALASDDGAELWLSEHAAGSAAQRLAVVTGYVDPGDYEAQPSQQSEPQTLVAGQTYRLWALHKQGGGGNHLSVAWQPPGATGWTVLSGADVALPDLDAQQREVLAATERAAAERAKLRIAVERAMARGETLPVSYSRQLVDSLEAPPPADTGINVLLDQSHQTQFVVLWGLRAELRGAGFRAVSSGAAVDTVLRPGARARIRLPLDELEPFAWWQTPRWNVVITGQQDLRAQPYTRAELNALDRYVRGGGGLLVIGGRPADEVAAEAWSLNSLLDRFGAACLPTAEESPAGKVASLRLAPEWEVLARGAGGAPIRARRAMGRGFVQIIENSAVINAQDADSPAAQTAKRALLRDTITALEAGAAPAGGIGRLPATGGMGIFPERSKRAGNVIVYYAANQPADVRRLIDVDLERAARQVLAWFPTKLADEPYAIVLCGGGGGGWAINPRPKAAAVIEYEPLSILGVFGHEMAHTMPGPTNDAGQQAGSIPIGNQGESHAGWFQGKLHALFSGEISVANRNCNAYTKDEAKAGRPLDLATEYETEGARRDFGYGTQWSKMWYVFQKLDDRYGPTWYPRWYWVRSTRWAAEPAHRETFDEMVETMSIAVGEDLFPFFRALGTSGLRERCAETTFLGQRIALPVAPLDTSPAGPVNLEPIGDYREPLAPRSP